MSAVLEKQRVSAGGDEMETVPPGYKRTEVGVIPEDWQVRPLGSALLKGRLGGNYPNTSLQSSFPLMKMGNVARGNFDLSKVEYIEPGVDPEQQHRLRSGDVLFNTRNTLELVGKVAIWRDEIPLAFYNSNLMRLEFDRGEIGSNEYANYALNTQLSISNLRGLATGTTSVAAIYTRDLLGLPFVAPPLPEQRAIAEALSDVDGLLGALEALIAKKRAIKQAAMQQLLTGKTRLPGFSGEWETKQLGELGRFRGGTGFPIAAQGVTSGDYPFFKVSDMNNEGNETFMRVANNYVSDEVRKALGATAFPANSIVFAKVGAAVFLERKKVLSKPSCLDNNMAGFVLDHGAADYRFIHLVFLNTTFGDFVSTTALPSLSNSILSSIECRLPPIDEQCAIATVLSDMDAEIAALEARRDKTRAIKRGMMQQLLTGRVRLVEPEAEVAA